MQSALQQNTNIKDKANNQAVLHLLDNPHAIKAERCRRSFQYFLEEFWDVIVNEEYVSNWHIPFLCEELQILAERVFDGLPKEYDLPINIPPGTTKSLTCAVMFPAWIWTRMPTAKIISGSYAKELSLEHAELSRDLIRSEKYKKYFPEIQLRQDKDAKSNYKNTLGGARLATSVGGTITGFHGHFIIVDDPINPKKAESTTGKELETVNKWMNRTLSSRKVNKEMVPTILIMQRLHEDDPSGNMLLKGKKGKPVKHICLPGTNDFKISPPELEEYYIDGLLDPIRLSESALKDMRLDLGAYGYAGQVGQDPKPLEGGIIELSHFKRYKVAPARKSISKLSLSFDTANKPEQLNDYSVCEVWAETSRGVFLLDIWRKKVGYPELKRKAKNLILKWTPNEVLIEDKSSGISLSQELKADQEVRSSIIPINPGSFSKLVRMENETAFIESGVVWLPEAAPWLEDFENEIVLFPNGKNDDQVDPMSQFLKRYREKSYKGSTPPPPVGMGQANHFRTE